MIGFDGIARAVRISLIASGLLAGAFATDATAAGLSAQSAADRAALALRWAPVHYQDVDQTGSHALGGGADYVTRYDFDGDLDGRNNWDRAGQSAYPLAAHGYYSVVETSTHWFITYLFFHPRDWTDSFFDTEHENDAEGVLFAIARDGSTYGTLKAAVTVAHTDFFSFVPAGSNWTAGAENVDGALSFLTYQGAPHPVTAQEAKGHGLKAWPAYNINGDGVIYYPSLTTAEVPSNADDRDVKYKLIDIFEPGGMWDQRNNSWLFAGYGSFAGDKTGGCGSGAIGCNTNSANAPWGWDDSNDGPGRGMLASDPVGLVTNYFRIPEGVSASYTYNTYR
ncbi:MULTISPECIES: hypothetical protein [unclassified Lysobacter]|uniref:hypothetical protein n=1 Tax=unclassified Lysobacter TaxID=2635362 RepID=UPI001BECBC10|nr:MULTISPECIES: hypothetical protein [unclassified Lysobacter]MBT2746116.1 hypothetical protein [Lysobacter sp. ISL-42]MBT2752551.1 hypothetical protein [Lysobacter sp. ISL-50]MBT2776720.1 hypothetical protein [Lysobacter sp. ISL-54]MBT2780712.1 hypothetical protein [Lysobacter sp. ISL-52]